MVKHANLHPIALCYSAMCTAHAAYAVCSVISGRVQNFWVYVPLYLLNPPSRNPVSTPA